MSERIGVVGIGKLGLCVALHAASKGFTVLGCDNRKEYVELLRLRDFRSTEPGVNQLLADNIPFTVTTDLEETVIQARTTFVFVSTPSLPDGSYNHDAIDEVLDALPTVGEHRDLVIGCTTMPGYVASRAERAAAKGFRLSYNPSFIAQGRILKDLASPDIVLVGQTEETGRAIFDIYQTLCPKPPFYQLSTTAAEVAKVALNCFLTMKIAFANSVGDLLHRLDEGPLVDSVLRAIGADRRVGSEFLGYGFGYGGPCLPRDNRALRFAARDAGMEWHLTEAIENHNRAHLGEQLEHASASLDDPIVFHGVAYKQGTDIIEESQALALAVLVRQSGRNVMIRDSPAVIESVRAIYGDRFSYEPTD